MALSGSTKIFTIPISNKLTYAWTGRDYLYSKLKTELGVDVKDPGDDLPDNVVFGSKTKPPRVSIRTTAGRSFIRFIAPNKIQEQVFQKKLVGKKITVKKKDGSGTEDLDICWVSMKSN